MMIVDRVHHGAEPATSHRSPSRAPATTKITKIIKITKRSQVPNAEKFKWAKMI